MLLSRPLQPQTFSHRYLAGAGISPLLQPQLEELARQPKFDNKDQAQGRKGKLVVIGHNCIEPLQALRKAGPEDIMDMKQLAEKQRNMENLRRKRKEKKKRLRVEKRDLNDVNNQVNSGAADCCTSIISECLIETFPGCQVEVLLNSSSLDPAGFYKAYPAAWTAILVSLNNNYVANCAALICVVKP